MDDWPGNDEADVAFDPEKLNEMAKTLERELGVFSGEGSLRQISSGGPATVADLGDWDTGQALANATGKAHGSISATYEAFVMDLQATASALRRSAANYHEAENASTHSARNAPNEGTPEQAPTRQSVPSAD